MSKYGALAFTWIGDWNTESGLEATGNPSAAGLDAVEISLLDPASFDPEPFGRRLADRGLEPYCTLVFPPRSTSRSIPTGPSPAAKLVARAPRRGSGGSTDLG